MVFRLYVRRIFEFLMPYFDAREQHPIDGHEWSDAGHQKGLDEATDGRAINFVKAVAGTNAPNLLEWEFEGYQEY